MFVFLFSYSLLSSTRGLKRSRSDMDSLDSGLGIYSFATLHPPKKKSKSDSDSSNTIVFPTATSTPFPSSHELSQDAMSTDDSGPLGASSGKKKTKKSRKEKDSAGNMSLNVSSRYIDTSLLDSSSTSASSRKKKKKDKDRDKQNLSFDRPQEMFNISATPNNLCSSGQENITIDRKRSKEKRRSEKSQNNVSLEMSDSSSSNTTLVYSVLDDRTSTGAKKKKKKSDHDSY